MPILSSLTERQLLSLAGCMTNRELAEGQVRWHVAGLAQCGATACDVHREVCRPSCPPACLPHASLCACTPHCRQVVFKAGDAGDTFYVVEEGTFG